MQPKIVFIVNPKAGKGRGVDALIDEIYDAAKKEGEGAFVYETKGIQDAERFAATFIRNNPEDEIRLYACGGDGTMNEVVNAVMAHQRATGKKNVAIGLVPIGSGNDFCKNFGSLKKALNITAQLKAEPIPSDVLCYTETVDGQEKVRYCANMINIGFDCNVADLAANYKKIPLVTGSMAYLISVFTNLIQKRGANLKIMIDGKVVHEGKVLLNSIANGPYCGGGIKSNPSASIHDGVMDINVVSDINRLGIFKLLPRYMKGTHMEMKEVDKIIKVYTTKEVTITPLDGTMRICIDGEIESSSEITITAQRDAFRFLKPQS